MRRTVLGYDQVVPAGLCATNSCRNSGAERNAPRTELCDCDPALISNPVAPRRAVGQSRENVETVQELIDEGFKPLSYAFVCRKRQQKPYLSG